MGLFISLVLSTSPKPTIVAVIPVTVPVKAGEASGAFAATAEFAVTSASVYPTFALFAVMSFACCEVIPTFAVFNAIAAD